MNGNKENHKTEAQKEEKTITLREADFLKLKEEAEKAIECQDKLLRMQADLENTRKRLEKEKNDFIKFANEGIVAELLTILDDLERAVSLAESKKEDLPVFLKGVEMILAHLHDMLKDYGVKPIAAEGKIFDPALHEALLQVENKDLAEHTIVEELQKGYTMNGRVIRTAKVKVSKKAA